MATKIYTTQPENEIIQGKNWLQVYGELPYKGEFQHWHWRDAEANVIRLKNSNKALGAGRTLTVSDVQPWEGPLWKAVSPH